MQLYQLYVPPQDEPEVKRLGAYHDRKSNAWYYSALDPDPGRFSRWQVIGNLWMESYSFSSLCQFIGVNLNAAKLFMSQQGYFDGDRILPTQKGYQYGIVAKKQFSQKGMPYTAYLFRDNFANYLLSNRQTIQRIEQEMKENRKQEKRAKEGARGMSSARRASAEPPMQNAGNFPATRFPKLQIPDHALILDTETTGFSAQDEVIELAVIDLDGNVWYNQRFRPYVAVNEHARAVHHISDAELMQAADFRDEFPRIMQILAGRPLIGHHISFDVRLLLQTVSRHCGPDASAYFQQACPTTIDSRNIIKNFMVVKENKLDSLCKMLGKPEDEKHRAVDDCLDTLWVLQAIEKRPFAALK